MLIGTIAGRTATVPLGMILGKRLMLRGTVLRARSIEEKRAATAAFARDVLPLLASGTVRPTVDRVFELDEIRAAHERLASNETFGKVVLSMCNRDLCGSGPTPDDESTCSLRRPGCACSMRHRAPSRTIRR